MQPAQPLDPRTRAHAWLLGALILGAVAMPLARGVDYDSFPWSSYPMFARGRADATGTLGHVVAASPDGRRFRPVPPPLVGSDEVLQAQATVSAAIRQGRAPELCRRVAERLAPLPAWSDFAWIEVSSDRYDALRYFAEPPETRPLRRDHHARCRILRP
jgi:hypothetical protein